jgi:TfoX/Sxy family transcriptional regulator of competence genes
MAYDEGLAERLRECFEGKRGITEKRMFGGLCFLLHGNMAVGITKNELMVRYAHEEHDAVMKMKDVRPMNFTKKAMKGFAFVGAKGFDAQEDLEAWVERCLSYVSTLPAK